MLVLRTVRADMRAPDDDFANVPAGSFTWPEKGEVVCSDWDPTPRCGGGLHGLLWGQGALGLLKYEDPTRKWMIVDVPSVIHIDKEKVKFERGEVVLCGTQDEAI